MGKINDQSTHARKGVGGEGKSSARGKGVAQAEKFAAAAREHGASEDEEAFKDMLRKIAKPKA